MIDERRRFYSEARGLSVGLRPGLRTLTTPPPVDTYVGVATVVRR